MGDSLFCLDPEPERSYRLSVPTTRPCLLDLPVVALRFIYRLVPSLC